MVANVTAITVKAEERHLTVLEVIEDNVQTLAVGAKVFDDNTAAAYDLAGVSLTIDFAETSPGAQNLRVTDFDEVDLVLGAESLDELDVFGLGTGLYQDAKVSLALVQGFGALPETASETIVNECVLQDLLKGLLDGKLSLGRLGGNLLDGGIDLNVISSVRHLLCYEQFVG